MYGEEPERFACFFSNSEEKWQQDMLCLLDAIRLFNLNRAGFGLCIHTRDGIGLNDLYKHDTNKDLWANTPKGLPFFSLNETERDGFQKFYSSYRNWFFKGNPGEKDLVTKKLIELYRLAFNVAESDTAMILLSQIWELFVQYFPDKKKGKKRGTSYKIKAFVSGMIRNVPGTKENSERNLYKIVGHLYKQRCILVHQETGDEFDSACIPVAFDVSRCLILKLINAKDDEMRTIVSKIDGCALEDVPYPDDEVKFNRIDPDLLKKIFKST